MVITENDLLFGKLAIKEGFISEKQLVETIRQFKKQTRASDESGLESYLISRNLITTEQAKKVRSRLKKLKGTRTQLVCDSCGKKHTVINYREDKKLSCSECTGSLVFARDAPPEKTWTLSGTEKSQVSDPRQQWAEAIDVTFTTVESTIKADYPVKEKKQQDSDDIAMADQKSIRGSLGTDFELLELIGEGGMGLVYTARQTSIDRKIALKLIKPGFDTDEENRHKFMLEAVVTGDLDHPNIVPVHDLGHTPDGKIFYTMKEVHGRAWKELMKKKSLPENLDILLRVCDAVAFAHDRGVIHRDLKPHNVMLGDYGEVNLMDWGIALSYDEKGKAEKPSQKSAIAGTPAYMPPEVARGEFEKIGPGSDIYLLGGILYEIVTGLKPHKGKKVLECIEKAMVNEVQPTDKKGELVDIALKAMATEPKDRHGSVKEFQEAIRLYRSHSESITLSAIAQDDLDRAQTLQSYDYYAQSLFGFREAYKLWPGNITAEKGILEASLAYARCAFQFGDLDLAASLLNSCIEVHMELQETETGESLEDHMILADKVEQARRDRENRKKRFKYMSYGLAGLATMLILLLTLAFFWIKGEKEKAIAAEKMARVAQMRESAQRLKAEKENYFNVIALAERKISDFSYEQAKSLLNQTAQERRGWEWGRLMWMCTPEMKTFRGHQAAVEAVAFSPGADMLATAGRDDTVKIWKVTTGQLIRSMKVNSELVETVGFSDKGKMVWIKYKNRTAEYRDIQTGKKVKTVVDERKYTRFIDVSPDGRLKATARRDNTAKIWDNRTNRIMRVLEGHKNYVAAVSFSTDGKYLITGSWDKTAIIWDVDTGEIVNTLRGHRDGVRSVAFSLDGRYVATGSLDHTVKVWNPFASREIKILDEHANSVQSVCFSPDNRLLVTAGKDRTARLWDVRTGNLLKSFTDHDHYVTSAVFSPDGSQIVTGSWDNTVKIREATTSRVVATLKGHTHNVLSVDFSPDGSKILTASWDGTAIIWDTETRQVKQTLKGHDGPVLRAKFSPDGKHIATAGKDGAIIVRKTGSGKIEKKFHAHTRSVYGLDFSPDGGRIASGSWDKTARIWDLKSGKLLVTLRGHTNGIDSVDFSPEGNRLATGSRDNTVKIWETRMGRELLTLKKHTKPVFTVAFSPDGKRLSTGGWDTMAIIWDGY